MQKIRIVSRKSQLALIQANLVARSLYEKLGIACEIIAISTQGDEIIDQSLVKIGGKGLFISSLQEYLLLGKADIAVHSAKDMPHTIDYRLTIAAVLTRGAVEDVLLTNNGANNISQLPLHAVVGTSSLRRAAQLLHVRPDLNIKVLRGNVPTRVDKLMQGQYDAIILAKAGLERLNMQHLITQTLPIAEFVPAACQGIIAIECLAGNQILIDLLRQVNCEITEKCLVIERDLCRSLQATCQSPVGVVAVYEHERIKMHCVVASPDGSVVKRVERSAIVSESSRLGFIVAQSLICQGAIDIINFSKEEILRT